VPKPLQTLIYTVLKQTSLQIISPEVTILFIKCSSLSTSNTLEQWKQTSKICMMPSKRINCMKNLSSLRTFSFEVKLTRK
jgi:hypothetical protein